MKKLFLVIAGVFMFAGASYAQEYKPFKFGLGLGYAMPSGEGAGGGVLFYGEPMYRIKDEIAVGLRMEGALVAKATLGPDGTYDSGTLKAAGISSYTLNGQYYLSNNTFRPLVGLGFGLYSVSTVAGTGDSQTASVGVAKENKFGFYPRIGFDAGHFNMSLEYNLIPSSEVPSMDTNGAASTIDVKNSYLGIKIGGSISGGRRK